MRISLLNPGKDRNNKSYLVLLEISEIMSKNYFWRIITKK